MSTWTTIRHPFDALRGWLQRWLNIPAGLPLKLSAFEDRIDKTASRQGALEVAAHDESARVAGVLHNCSMSLAGLAQQPYADPALLGVRFGELDVRLDEADSIMAAAADAIDVCHVRRTALATYVQLQHSSCSAVRSVLGVPATAQPCRLRPGTLPVPCTLEGCPQRAIHGRLEELMQEALGASGEG